MTGARALDHHDAVGAIGHRGAGHDARRLTGTDDDAGDVIARADVSDHVECDGCLGSSAREIGGAHGEAVHRGVVERRDVDVTASISGEHAAERVEQVDILGGESGQAGEDELARLLDGHDGGLGAHWSPSGACTRSGCV